MRVIEGILVSTLLPSYGARIKKTPPKPPKEPEKAMTITTDIVAKLWRLCDILRDDGITYHEYVTELTLCCSR